MPKNSPRPSRHIHKNYSGELGTVVGIEDSRRDTNGAVLYKLQCKDCGEVHLRNAKHLKNSIRASECKHYKPHNFVYEDKRDGVLRRFYGITLEKYNEMYAEQEGLCYLCGKPDEVEGRRLAVDHCHETGTIRRLLCGNCNRGLGNFQDNPALLQKAFDYLNNYSRAR